MSPWVLIPPSAISGLRAALEHQRRAASCQPPVPNPVFIFVIQTFPGPMPTFVASAPAFSSSRTASGVPTFPAIMKVFGRCFLMCCIILITEFECPCAMSIVI